VKTCNNEGVKVCNYILYIKVYGKEEKERGRGTGAAGNESAAEGLAL
jgi:hypothetical protein